MSASGALKASALSWLLPSAGHTLSAGDFQNGPQFRALPNHAYACSTVGWYQGSGYFLLTALINYHWAQYPETLKLPTQKLIAALASAIIYLSSAWYYKKGLKPQAILTALTGTLQAWAAFKAT